MIREHHRRVEHDLFLNRPVLGGNPLQGYPVEGIWIEDVAFDNGVIKRVQDNDNVDVHPMQEDRTKSNENGSDAPPHLDEYHEVHRQVMEALARGDALHEEAEAPLDSNDQDDEGVEESLDGLEDLYIDTTIPMFPSSRTSIVSATIIIMNMCTVFRVSNKFTDKLFQFLSVDLLPTPNKLSGTHYATQKSIRRLVLNYQSLHACANGCVLYKGEYATLNTCPRCQESRWMDGSNRIPSKVIRHFPLIPRLKRMWRSSEIAQMLMGYTKHIS